MSNPQESWERFKKFYTDFPTIGLAVDLSRMKFPDKFFETMAPRMQKAFSDMAALEGGEIANPDEGRMVGHYWLRNPALAPTPEIRDEIERTLKQIKKFAADVHAGAIRGANGPFKNLLVIGIGGSALGPQFVANALSHPHRDKLKPFFFDNTDPDGMQRVLETIGDNLGQTICVVISKSGGTKETRNGMLVAKAAYSAAGLPFEMHAVAITKDGSELHRTAVGDKWLRTFPMWDWVGGRTSELSAVGLLPAALQGFTIEEMLAGAKACDLVTRVPDTSKNPAALLALTWFAAGDGHGKKNMVIIPYKDRFELLSRYLQQLVMESLGKRLDLSGKTVNQGISVFGNKGSTDQHAYVQQLIDGKDDYFLTLIEVLKDQDGAPFFVEPDISSGDYLHGFYLGTREAITGSGRQAVTLTLSDYSAFAVGVLIALFERIVGLYASLININAYHQPGVEAGKKAATSALELQTRIMNFLASKSGNAFTIQEIASAIKAEQQVEMAFKICEHLAANPGRGIGVTRFGSIFDSKYLHHR